MGKIDGKSTGATPNSQRLTPNSQRLKNLPAAHFSNQSSEWHPKVFVKTFG